MLLLPFDLLDAGSLAEAGVVKRAGGLAAVLLLGDVDDQGDGGGVMVAGTLRPK